MAGLHGAGSLSCKGASECGLVATLQEYGRSKVNVICISQTAAAMQLAMNSWPHVIVFQP